MFGVFFFTSVAVYAVSLQAIAYLVEIGFDPLRAASAFGFTGMLSVVGMVAAGWLADRRSSVRSPRACSRGSAGSRCGDLVPSGWCPATRPPVQRTRSDPAR
jgi:hypothetical protein